jgi:2-dehydropantoate 2-reductase
MTPPVPIPNRPSIAIVGAGALGGYYGARLAQHGHEVHFLIRGDYDAVRKNGLVVRSCNGDFTLPPNRVKAYRSPADMPKVDLVVVTLKTTSNDQIESLVRPLLHETTTVLTLQNGLGNEDHLARLFGPARILGGIAFVCINRKGPGVIEHTSHGLIRVGSFAGGAADPRAAQVARFFTESQVRCETVENLLATRWLKLAWNIPFNGLGAVMDLTTDRLIGTQAGEALVRTLIAEVIAAAAADGVVLPPDTIDNQINPTREMGAYRSSMQVDRQEHRPLEFEAILGEPLRRAKAKGVATPLLESVYAMSGAVSASLVVRSA